MAAAILLAVSAQAQDTLHLTDGTEVQGTIVEWIPGESVKLRSEKGVVSISPASMVAKMTRQPEVVPLPTVLPAGPPVVPRPLHRPRHPAVAFMLSAFVPGSGQLYNGEPGKGVVHLGTYLFGTWASWPARDGDYASDEETRVSIGATMVVGSMLVSALDALVSAFRINKKLEAVQLSVAPAGVRLTVGL